MKRLLTLFLIMFYFLGPVVASAETRYVTDRFEITLRSGKSTQNEILRLLPSGTAVEILELDTAAGYAKVRVAGGTEGWVLTRYLMDTPDARARLVKAEGQLAQKEQALQKLQQEMQELNSQKSQIEQERNRLNDQNLKINRELADIKRVSANAIQISDENQQLKTRMAEVEREIQFLQQENVTLKDRSQRDWFIVGAIVVVTSMFLGILITRIRWRRRSGWGDL